MSRDTNFYYSFLVLTPAKRRAIVAVWDFCRAIDDAVDEMRVETEPRSGRGDGAAGRVAPRRSTRCSTAVHRRRRRAVALQPFIAAFDLPQRPLEDLVDGVAMDIGSRRYKTFGELYQVLLPRRLDRRSGLRRRSSGARKRLRATMPSISGVALQLTNILRDVAVDLERGRLYIPLDDLDALRLQRGSDSHPAAVGARQDAAGEAGRARA